MLKSHCAKYTSHERNRTPILLLDCMVFNAVFEQHNFSYIVATSEPIHAFLENIVEKGEIARNEQFLLFPQCFLLNQIIVSPFVHIFDIISLFAAELEEPKIDM